MQTKASKTLNIDFFAFANSIEYYRQTSLYMISKIEKLGQQAASCSVAALATGPEGL